MLVSSWSLHAVLGIIKMIYVDILLLLVHRDSPMCLLIHSQMCLFSGPKVKSFSYLIQISVLMELSGLAFNFTRRKI